MPQPPKVKVSTLSWSQGVTHRCQHSTWSGLSTLTTCTPTTAATKYTKPQTLAMRLIAPGQRTSLCLLVDY